jgi:hydroxymethylbilane synthase
VRVVRIATRSSAQATAQSTAIAAALRTAHPTIDTELVFVETLGDQRTDVPLHSMGGQGVFVKEVQRAVLDGHADVAVHSAKDLPSAPTDGLTIAAFAERRTANDALIGASLATLPAAATVATGSVRRSAQLGRVRPDLTFTELRGNIHTRLSKVPEGGAIVMAVAALEILGLTDRVAQVLPVDEFTPAPGQGCVAVECRADDGGAAELLAAVDHPPSRAAVLVERAYLATLGTGCSLPVGAHCVDDVLYAFLAGPTGEALNTSIALSGDTSDRAAQAAALAASMHSSLALVDT